MTQIAQILFPVDFSDRCIAAVPHVDGWAERFGASVIALHVVDPASHFASPDLDDPRIKEELSTLSAQRSLDLDYFCAQYLPAKLALRKIVSVGGIVDVIVSAAQDENAALIMLPRGHQSMAARLFHDSVTAKVMNASPAPVWTSEKLHTLPVKPPEKILCAVHVDADLSLDAANHRLLDFVRLVAQSFGSSVTCLYVAPSKAQLEIPSIAARLENIRHEMRDLAEFQTTSGSVQNSIVQIANETKADLIMLGRTRIGTVGLGVQIHLLTIDHEAPCPLLSVF